jgi:Programmed cell death protein 2, C-terminal putative domain
MKIKAKQKVYGVNRTIPNCQKCGSSRVFEFQILPSLLHALKVDRMVDTSGGVRSVYEDGGMDWGNIAVYTCPNRCNLGEEYCVIQDSVDELPIAEQLVSPGNGQFVVDEDDIDDDDEEETIDGTTQNVLLDGMTYECDDDDDW